MLVENLATALKQLQHDLDTLDRTPETVNLGGGDGEQFGVNTIESAKRNKETKKLMRSVKMDDLSDKLKALNVQVNSFLVRVKAENDKEQNVIVDRDKVMVDWNKEGDDLTVSVKWRRQP